MAARLSLSRREVRAKPQSKRTADPPIASLARETILSITAEGLLPGASTRPAAPASPGRTSGAVAFPHRGQGDAEHVAPVSLLDFPYGRDQLPRLETDDHEHTGFGVFLP
jgi:hypothetical protein